MPNLISGSGILGRGFNARKEYAINALSSALFDLRDSGEEWTAENKITYSKPTNTTITSGYESTGMAKCFSTRKQVEEHFSEQAGLSVKSFGFTGKFDALYSTTRQREDDYSYALYELSNDQWRLTLEDLSTDAIGRGFKRDVDDLPQEFTPENEDTFFSLFEKYGTHFVHEVTVGARLYYTLSVLKTFSSDEKQIEANLKLEYKASFLSTEATSHTEWTKLTKEWTESRIAIVKAMGGTHEILNAVIPEFDVNHHNVFEIWIKSIPDYPVVTDFKVRPISQIFSGNKQKAIKEALETYLAWIHVESSFESCTIAVGGIPVRTTRKMPTGPFMGFQAAVINQRTHQAIFSQIYQFPMLDPERLKLEPVKKMWEERWEAMRSELHKLCASPDHILALASYRMRCLWFPPATMAEFMRHCGADKGLWLWENAHDPSRGRLTEESCNYTLIGMSGLGAGVGFDEFTLAATRSEEAPTVVLDVRMDELGHPERPDLRSRPPQARR